MSSSDQTERDILKMEPGLSFSSKGVNYQLIRLDDRNYSILRERSIAISTDYSFLCELYLSAKRCKKDLNFAEVTASKRDRVTHYTKAENPAS